MNKERRYVYIVKSDYTPDAGSTIYGCYLSYTSAQKRVEELESPDNEYGHPIEDLDIDQEYLED